MDYAIKVGGATVAGAWSRHAARRKALAIAHGQAALDVRDRRHVEVWKGVYQVSAFSPAHTSEHEQ